MLAIFLLAFLALVVNEGVEVKTSTSVRVGGKRIRLRRLFKKRGKNDVS